MSIFYIGTGPHGSRVFVGVLFLLVNLFRIKLYNFNWYHVRVLICLLVFFWGECEELYFVCHMFEVRYFYL